MSRRVARKWRPSLAFVLSGTLAAVFLLPLIGVAYIRLVGGLMERNETSWLIAWITLAATLVLGFLLWRLVLRPVRALTAYALNDGETIPPRRFGTSEFSELGQAVLGMTATLRGREAVLRSYADHVTHELKSPLTVVRGAAELLDDPDLKDVDRSKMLENIRQATERMEALLNSQRDLARAQDLMPEGNCLLSDVLASFPDVVIAQDGEVPLPHAALELVMTHLVNNARDHGAQKITVTHQRDRIMISDDGPGISSGNRDRIFDPFFTTRRDKGGTGMGLPIVRRMLEAQNADIALVDGPGATFEIQF